MSRGLAPYWKTAMASAARTATNNSGEIYNPGGYRGIRVFIDMTAYTATGGLVVGIQVKDPIGGDWSASLLDSASIAAATTAPVILEVYPGTTAAANAAISRTIGRSFRILATHGNGVSLTYSIAVEFLP